MDGEHRDYKFHLRRCPRLTTQSPPKPQKKILVRMPAELHEAVFEAAHDARKSMNAFAIDALEAAVLQAEVGRERALAAPGRE